MDITRFVIHLDCYWAYFWISNGVLIILHRVVSLWEGFSTDGVEGSTFHNLVKESLKSQSLSRNALPTLNIFVLALR